MKKPIVIINGTGGSGKDSFVTMCQNYAKVMGVSSVDKVKHIAKLIGWDGGKTDKDRKFLSDLKMLTVEYNDMPFNSIKEAVENFKKSDSQILFIHIREPEEIKKAVKAFGAKTLLIKRAGQQNITTNSSDANVDNYNYDYVIENITLKNLEQNAESFVGKILKSAN